MASRTGLRTDLCALRRESVVGWGRRPFDGNRLRLIAVLLKGVGNEARCGGAQPERVPRGRPGVNILL
jgi:hypothetical protein